MSAVARRASPNTPLGVRSFNDFQTWNAADPAAATAIAAELDRVALAGAATVPLGQIYARYAFRRSITGVLTGTVPYPWNVRPV